jgi:hypothetical protein
LATHNRASPIERRSRPEGWMATPFIKERYSPKGRNAFNSKFGTKAKKKISSPPRQIMILKWTKPPARQMS